MPGTLGAGDAIITVDADGSKGDLAVVATPEVQPAGGGALDLQGVRRGDAGRRSHVKLVFPVHARPPCSRAQQAFSEGAGNRGLA